MLRAGTLLFALLVTSAVRADTPDCISQGGERLCTGPVLKSEKVNLCSETGTWLWIMNLEQSFGWGSVGTTVDDIISKVNCFENGVTGCAGGTQTQFPSWSVPGDTYNSWNCWTITTTTRNGYVLNPFVLLTASTTKKDSEGRCTLTGQPFPISVVAMLSRDVSCPTGWNTTTLSNGDYQCWRCPDNSTQSGTQCVCNPGFVKDPSTRLCVPACPNDAACDDHDFCNGTERCVAGLCQPGTRQTCDDGIRCTMDICSSSQNKCTNELDPLSCSCNYFEDKEEKVPISKSFSLLNLECPVIGDTSGVSIDLKGELAGKTASCETGCVSSGSTELSVSLKTSAPRPDCARSTQCPCDAGPVPPPPSPPPRWRCHPPRIGRRGSGS